MPEENEQQQQAQPDLAAEELVRLRELARKFGPLQGIADALESDPSKIFAIQAAMEGRTPQPQQQEQPRQNQKLTQEQIDELNRQAITNPAETMAAIANLAMQQARQEIYSEASPLLGTTADLVIESFKGRKAAEDDLYRQIVPLFDAELRDVGRQNLIGMDPATRLRTLELRWNSAAAAVFRKAAATIKKAEPINNGGGSGGGQPLAPKRGIQKDANMAALADRLGLTAEEQAEINQELEDEGF